MTPDVDTAWVDDDNMPEGRSMGNFIFLPDGRLFLLNGIAKGTAGYGNVSWAIGQSFGDEPLCVHLLSSGVTVSLFTNPRLFDRYQAAYYDPYAPSGSKWSRPSDLKPSTIARMYHSAAGKPQFSRTILINETQPTQFRPFPVVVLLPDGSIMSAGSNPNGMPRSFRYSLPVMPF